jgi:hypothetical protein
MPDTSKISSIGRRLRAAAPLVSNKLSVKSVLIPLAVAGTIVGAFFFFRRYQRSEINT